MNSKQKLLTIGVPIYRVEKYLSQCLDSLIFEERKQQYRIVLVDDQGGDDSIKIAQTYQDKYPDLFEIIYLPQNLGVSSARNYVIDSCTTPYIMFVDSDDWLGDGAILHILEAIVSVQPDLIVFDYVRCYEYEDVKVTLKNIFNGDISLIPKQKLFSSGLPVTPWAKVFKKELFNDLRFKFRINFEDLAVIPEVVCNADRVHYAQLQYMYRQDVQSSAMFEYELNTQKILKSLNELACNASSNNKMTIELILFHNLVSNIKRLAPLQDRQNCIFFIKETVKILNHHFPNWQKNHEIIELIKSQNRLLFFKQHLYLTLLKSSKSNNVGIFIRLFF